MEECAPLSSAVVGRAQCGGSTTYQWLNRSLVGYVGCGGGGFVAYLRNDAFLFKINKYTYIQTVIL